MSRFVRACSFIAVGQPCASFSNPSILCRAVTVRLEAGPVGRNRYFFFRVFRVFRGQTLISTQSCSAMHESVGIWTE